VDHLEFYIKGVKCPLFKWKNGQFVECVHSVPKKKVHQGEIYVSNMPF
jgi:hypothetical protein